MFFSLVDAICLCAFYACIAYSFGPFIQRQDSSSLNLIFYALIPVVLRALLRSAIAKVIAHLSYTVESSIREELMLKVLKVGPLSLTVQSSLSTLLVDAFDDIMPYFTHFLVALRYAMVIPVVILVAVALVSPWSSVILFVMAPLIPFFMILIGKGAERLNQKQWRGITRLSGRFYEACDKLLLLKLFNLEQREIEKVACFTTGWRIETMHVLRIAFLSALVLEFFATCGIALCAITLGFAVYEHGFDYTRALFVLLCVPEFFLPLRQLGLNYHARMRSLGAMSGLMQLLQEQSIFKLPAPLEHLESAESSKTAHTSDTANTSVTDNAATAAQASLSDITAAPVTSGGQDSSSEWLRAPYRIELHQVSAAYPNGRVGLYEMSGVIEASQVTVLIGPSGAGKSTLLQTIAGFTKLLSGSIVVNQHVCAQDDLAQLMKHMAYIPQLPHLFFGTLRDNLKLGAPEATDAELIQALKKVGAGHLLERFSDGLDHRVGDNNRGVSGGEVRLIALARAFVRQCDLLLLDEPTASLDKESEQAFLDALRRLAQGKTVIIVAHRPELIEFADTVLKLELCEPQIASQEDSQTKAKVAQGNDQSDVQSETKAQAETEAQSKSDMQASVQAASQVLATDLASTHKE